MTKSDWWAFIVYGILMGVTLGYLIAKWWGF